MWVKLTKSYTGPLGFFAKDAVMDLPEAAVKKLKKYCRRCLAPWDEHKDVKAAKEAEAKAELCRLKERAERIGREAGELKARIGELKSQAESRRKEADNAKAEYERATKKAPGSIETNDDTER